MKNPTLLLEFTPLFFAITIAITGVVAAGTQTAAVGTAAVAVGTAAVAAAAGDGTAEQHLSSGVSVSSLPAESPAKPAAYR